MKTKVEKTKGTKSPSRHTYYKRIEEGLKMQTRYEKMHPNHYCTAQCPKFRK